MENRVRELDYVRVISMLAIITLHVTGAYIFSASSLSIAGMNLAFILNQLSRFGVPAFIVLSGLSLGIGKLEESAVRFYSGRLLKIGLPYLIWYNVYLFYNVYRGTMKIPKGAFGYFTGFLTGNAAPHLYFTVVIFQLYILYPLIKRLLTKHRITTLAVALLISLAFQCGIYFNAVYGLRIFPEFIKPYVWLLFPTWIFYFTLGAAVSKERLLKISEKGRRFLPLLIVLAAALGFLYSLMSKADGSFELSIKPQLFIYVPLAFITFLSLGAYLKSLRVFNSAVLFLSKRSLTVYFLHVLILNVFFQYGLFRTGMAGMLQLLAEVTLLSIAGAFVIDAAVSGISRLLKNKKSQSTNNSPTEKVRLPHC